MATSILLPEMGEGVIEGTLSRWLVNEGDRIEQFAPIAEVETDKVTTETTSDTAGVILKLCVNEGQTIPVGTVLAYVGQPGETVGENGGGGGATTATAATTPPAKQETPVEQAIAPRPENGGAMAAPAVYTGRISPVVGRMAAEHGIDLGRVTGTGRDGRVTKEDVLAYIESEKAAERQPPAPAPSTRVGEAPLKPPAPLAAGGQVAAGPQGDVLPLTGIRRSIAEHMVRSKQTSPHVTTVFEIDFTAVAAHRKAHKDSYARDGVRLTFTAYLVAATVQALKDHPMVNSSWADDGILLRREINIGMATAIDDGLIVPVIKNADSLNLLGLARAVNDLADRARNKQLKPDEVKGGTFSITNHGTTGSLFATPIINQPQCGILGVGAIEKRVKVIDDAIAIRPLAYVSFTFDHRILDGASADRFVAAIKQQIEGWR
ncbi:2-oxoglutarate dehydrogenase E2 component, dihydrolipoamide succinyltransferase [Candidatus Promineifilum breve]|uniref:Dihydrolipoamide acetyltransferase component of pyruvate dehydrogenase complex n=1 Tax=Candidatus Promineifilum breve TaxID=1806508 RepID=A0A160T5W5_9CHLR|nr:dihydrolipoamide acetyltransferase family protein [Candidatus Promineifilum breve]CUS05364.2 2-oxoglutarate dehydrogenase E2 component, dihydrolipoamide succinyltransferase [Candidatus Promineifilum breve]